MQEEEREGRPILMPSLSFRETPIIAVESPQKISAVEPGGDAAEGGEREAVKDDEDFEFAFVLRGLEAGPPITADEIFSDGRIRPVYPVFNRDLLLLPHDAGEAPMPAAVEEERPARLSLRRLLIEERETAARSSSLSSSSSDGDELEGIPPDSYCVWTPRRAAEPSPGRCRKSSSMGSSLRWRLRDLVVGRSHSDGKEKFVFLAAEEKKDAEPEAQAQATAAEHKKDSKAKGITGNSRSGSGRRAKEMDVVTAHRMYYAKSSGGGAGANANRRSFLPYKRDLVGFFASVNSLSRAHHPF